MTRRDGATGPATEQDDDGASRRRPQDDQQATTERDGDGAGRGGGRSAGGVAIGDRYAGRTSAGDARPGPGPVRAGAAYDAHGDAPMIPLSATAPRTTLADYVVEVIRAKTASGELRPGQHLREAELAAALGVSRGPVREALALLEAEGQVEIRRHRGAFVSVLTQQDVEEVHTLRAAIETLAAERATTRLRDEHLAEMDRILEAMKGTSGSVAPQEAVHLDLAFHDVIYAAADHARLSRVWTSIRSQVSFFLHTRNLNFPDFPTVGYPEHHELRIVLSQGDPAAARVAVEKHMTGAYSRLRQLELPSGGR